MSFYIQTHENHVKVIVKLSDSDRIVSFSSVQNVIEHR